MNFADKRESHPSPPSSFGKRFAMLNMVGEGSFAFSIETSNLV